MFHVSTPRGSMKVPPRLVANAADRLFRLSPDRQAAADDKARAVLERRDSLRAAATRAAARSLVHGRLAA